LKSNAEIRTDFDVIATALRAAPPETHLTAALRAVLDAIPATARRGLEVGCGDGLLARAVAARGVAMLAIDLAPQMIALAQLRTDSRLPIVYQVADIMSAGLAPQSFDVVFSVNMVHHLPIDVVLPRLAMLVAPGGRLIIQDVVTRVGFRHLPVNVAAALWRRLRQIGRRPRAARTVQLLYDRHGVGETYLTPPRVTQTLTPFLPGVVVTHHLDWRYTAVWNRALAI
jgi:2-polyprenyl-3-methyl-5-hydroxy-6-metoxy-1,4-benzoquinol methylase